MFYIRSTGSLAPTRLGSRPGRDVPLGRHRSEKARFAGRSLVARRRAASGAIGHAPRLSRASVIRSLDFLVLRKWTCAEDARTSRARAVYWCPREVYSAIYSSQSERRCGRLRSNSASRVAESRQLTWQRNQRHLPYPSHFDANNLEMVASALAAAPSVCLRAPSGARQIRRASGRNARVARVRPTTPTPRSDSTI